MQKNIILLIILCSSSIYGAEHAKVHDDKLRFEHGSDQHGTFYALSSLLHSQEKGHIKILSRYSDFSPIDFKHVLQASESGNIIALENSYRQKLQASRLPHRGRIGLAAGFLYGFCFMYELYRCAKIDFHAKNERDND